MKAAVPTEFAKMRRLRVLVLTAIQVAVTVGLALFAAVSNPDFVRSETLAWDTLLLGLAYGVTMASPLLLAVMVSRQVDIEHQSNGWILSGTTGITAGALCRAKLIALGVVTTSATLLISALVLASGFLLGVTAPPPVGRWAGYTAAALVINLVLAALHVLLSARVVNQLVCIGIGLLGSVWAMFGSGVPSWLAHASPWGYYALARPAEYRGEALVALTPAYPSIAVLAVLAAVVFGLITNRFDHQEA